MGSRHNGNIYEDRGKAGWMIRWKDFQGRRRGRLVKVTSKDLALKALAAEVQKVERERYFGESLPSEDTFAAFAKEFIQLQENKISSKVTRGKISQAEFTRQMGIVSKCLIPAFGTMKLAAVRRADIIKFINKRQQEVSDGSVIKEIGVLKRLFTVACDLAKTHANPASRVPLPAAPAGRERYLTPDEWMTVFKACAIPPTESDPEPVQWLQQAAGLAVSLGTRRGELMFTTIPDVDLDARKVTLRVTKSGKVRVVSINDLAMQVFESMEIRKRKSKRDRGVLFPGITPEQLSMRFIRVCRDAGIEDFSFHDLRHTYASHLRMGGADLDDIRRLLGHSDLRMTIRYAHLGQDHLDSAASRLNGRLTLPSADDSTNTLR